MDYQKLYDKICGNNREITRQVGYEIHHKIPVCLGGSNDSTNLVKLTYKEHYIAHLLLVKLAKNNNELIKMSQALLWLCKSNNGIRITNSRWFEKARKISSTSMSLYKNEIIGDNGETRAKIASLKTAITNSVKDKYHWWHPIHGDVICSPYELSLKFGLKGRSPNLLQVAKELRKTCVGWRLNKNKDLDYSKIRSQNCSKSAKARTDKRKNQFTKG